MNAKCVICKGPATKKVIWADGRAYQPSCAKHVRNVQAMLTQKNGKMTELAGVQDLTDTVDLVASAVYPGLERKPGGPDNWVERAGGLPKYIERIAKHLHYERGYSISRAIATAVNTVKRWARMGKVAKYGDPNQKHVTAKTAALAAKAVAQWEAKKAAGKIHLSDVLEYVIDLTDISDEFALELAEEIQSIDLSEYDSMGTGAEPTPHGTLLSMDIKALAQRANQIEDPEARGRARRAVLDLAVPRSELTAEKRKKRAKSGQAMADGSFPIFDRTSLKSAIRLARTPAQRIHVIRRARALGLSAMIPTAWGTDLSERSGAGVIDLASTIAPRNARGRASDGRRSYRGQGKWKHGFVPANRAAKEAKAKGSPIAIKRLNRIFGGESKPDDARQSTRENTAPSAKSARRRGGGSQKGERGAQTVSVDDKGVKESASDIAHLRNAKFQDKVGSKQPGRRTRKEVSKESRTPARAKQPWEDIPESDKTVRNGKRYVVTTFGGKRVITEWVGNVREQDTGPLNKRKTQATLASGDAASMSTAELRQLIKNPRTAPAARKSARAALRAKGGK